MDSFSDSQSDASPPVCLITVVQRTDVPEVSPVLEYVIPLLGVKCDSEAINIVRSKNNPGMWVFLQHGMESTYKHL